VAEATLRALEKGKNEVTLTFKGKLLVFFNRFFPRLVDRIIRRKVAISSRTTSRHDAISKRYRKRESVSRLRRRWSLVGPAVPDG